MTYVKYIVVEKDEENMRLDRWFKNHYPHINFVNLQKILRSGQIRLDKKRVKSNDRIQSGQVIRIPPIVNSINYISKETKEYDLSINKSTHSDFLKSILLYKDSEIYVFNKPAGISVQGGSGIVNHIDGFLQSWTDYRGQKPRLIHRLDRETSGILVVARTRTAAQILTEAFRMRKIQKIYWSLVWGIPKDKKKCVSNWLLKKSNPGGDCVRVVEKNEKGANYAISYFRVMDCFAQKFCWLEMQPYTGRTHQLRVHALHIGYPIVGDKKYSINSKRDFIGNIQNKLYLHARYIDLPHPAGGRLRITAPLPAHMVETWDDFCFQYNQELCVQRL
ncbi:RluA family pseudouridine synthase [Candidatus Liberibacter brunswickensis]|uniref:RluA family pseudouridine synthase n=1 Tax=Candidatus Liberibacter brunswickensis TaxID=1968796 RepID=UPI002FE0259C